MKRHFRGKKQVISRVVLACVILAMMPIGVLRVQAAAIVVDGYVEDWSGITKQASLDGSVPEWAIAQDDTTLYFYAHEVRDSIWYHPALNQWPYLTYENGTNDYRSRIGVQIQNDGLATVLDNTWNTVSSARAAYVMSEDGMQGNFEFSIPKTFLADSNYSITYCGVTVASADIPWVGGESATDPGENTGGSDVQNPEDTGNVRYEGIIIDGQFADWNAVTKTSVNENKGWNTVDEVAMVWDGDYIYLYFMAQGEGYGIGNWASVTGAGPYNNGQFAITTDLGKTLLIQLSSDGGGSVKGVDGAQVAVNNRDWFGAPHMWEVSIPSSALGAYKNMISFGIYQGDTLVYDVANLQGGAEDTDEENKDFNGIVIDGLYGDWENYPHTVIQYATGGTQEHKVDGEAALYSTEGMLYAHAKTEMKAHRKEAGGEFTSAVTIRLNGKYDFYPQFVTVDAWGNINYSPQLSNLPKGTYEFYIIDATGWKTAANISELEKCHNALYGRMYVTVGSSSDEMEFEMDLAKLAEKFGMDADEIKTIEAQWGRIGQQWVSTAGASTGTWAGLLICFAGVGVASYIQHRRKKFAK